ncbi:Uncharacterised protein g10546 [Pycnogonum litorale]
MKIIINASDIVMKNMRRVMWMTKAEISSVLMTAVLLFVEHLATTSDVDAKIMSRKKDANDSTGIFRKVSHNCSTNSITDKDLPRNGTKWNDADAKTISDFVKDMIKYNQAKTLTLVYDNMYSKKKIKDIIKILAEIQIRMRIINVKNGSSDDTDRMLRGHMDRMEKSDRIIITLLTTGTNAIYVLKQATKHKIESNEKTRGRLWVLCTEEQQSIFETIYINVKMKVIVAEQFWKKHERFQMINKSEWQMTMLYSLYHDFESNSTRSSSIGNWSEQHGLRASRTLSECCINITGARIKIATMNEPPWTFITEDKDGKYVHSGFLIDILQMLTASLKIKYELSYNQENDFGSIHNSDSSWTGIIGELQQKKADIGLILLEMNGDKMDILDFSPVIIYDGPTIIIPKAQGYFNWTGYLLPFEWDVWLSIILIYVIVSCLLSFATTRKNKYMQAAKKQFWTLLAVSPQQGVKTPKNISARVFFITYAFFMLLITQMYNSIVISFLTVSRNQLPFTDVQGLVDSDYKWIVKKGSDMDREMAQYFPKTVKKETIEEKKVQVKTAKEGLSLLNKYSKVAYLSLQNEAHYLTRGTCNYTFIDIFSEKQVSFLHLAYPKHSIYQEVINRQLVKMAEGGMLSRLLKKYTRSTMNCYQKERLAPFNLNQVILPFLILIAGTIFSALGCCAELFTAKLYLKKGCRHDLDESNIGNLR